MKICGFEIDAYIEENGSLRKKGVPRGRGKKVSFDPKKLGNKTLKKILALDRFLRYHKFNFMKTDFRILVEVTQKYLQCSEASAYQYAFTIMELRC